MKPPLADALLLIEKQLLPMGCSETVDRPLLVTLRLLQEGSVLREHLLLPSRELELHLLSGTRTPLSFLLPVLRIPSHLRLQTLLLPHHHLHLLLGLSRSPFRLLPAGHLRVQLAPHPRDRVLELQNAIFEQLLLALDELGLLLLHPNHALHLIAEGGLQRHQAPLVGGLGLAQDALVHGDLLRERLLHPLLLLLQVPQLVAQQLPHGLPLPRPTAALLHPPHARRLLEQHVPRQLARSVGEVCERPPAETVRREPLQLYRGGALQPALQQLVHN